MPVYSSSRVGGQDHAPLWQATLTISLYKDATVQQFRGIRSATKKVTEEDAARKALKAVAVASPRVATATALKLRKKTALLVDLENKPKSLSVFFGRVPRSENIHVVVFASRGHPTLRVLGKSEWSQDPRLQVIKSPPDLRDGADTAMVLWIGMQLAFKQFQVYAIITSDHVGKAIVETAPTLSSAITTYEIFCSHSMDFVISTLLHKF